jgi:hypothetical protein
MTRKPKQFEVLSVRGSNDPEIWFYGLTYSEDRGFFEPITNQDAEPILGEIIEWVYADVQVPDLRGKASAAAKAKGTQNP